MNLVAHVQRMQAAGPQAVELEARSRKSDEKTVAVIEIEGTMTKHGSSLSDAGSTIAIRRQVRTSARDPGIDGILLRIDSPGGTVAGTADLAKEVREARSRKPVFAFVEDLAASAAYWVASSADKVFANDTTAFVGGIGTYIGLYDLSGHAAQQGIRALVVKSGKFKGAGFPGTEITQEQQEHFQDLVDKTQAQFTAAVSQGRSLTVERVSEIADGRVHMASDAQSLGLIDGIKSFDDTVAELVRATDRQQRRPSRAATAQPAQEEEAPMAFKEDSTAGATAGAEKPATFEQLKESLVGADADLICSQMEKKATLAEATRAWMTEQAERLQSFEKARKQSAKASAKEEPLKKKTRQIKAAEEEEEDDAVGTEFRSSQGGGSEAESEWDIALHEKMERGIPRSRAVSQLVRERPDLRESYVESVNERVGPSLQRAGGRR